jgi:hypothetical protein
VHQTVAIALCSDELEYWEATPILGFAIAVLSLSRLWNFDGSTVRSGTNMHNCYVSVVVMDGSAEMRWK